MRESVEILRVKTDSLTCQEKLKGDMGPDGYCYIKLRKRGDESFLERLVVLKEGVSRTEKV